MSRRVVITGGGIICPIGKDVDEVWENCLEGKTNVNPIPEKWLRYSDYESRFWSPLCFSDFSELGFSRSQILQTDPVSLLAVYSTKQALQNAGIELRIEGDHKYKRKISNLDSTRIGVYMGTGVGGANSFLENHYHPILSRLKGQIENLLRKTGENKTDEWASILEQMFHLRRVNPFVVSMLMPNAVSAQLGLHFGINGPNLTCCVACASGTSAIGNAYRAIKSGLIDVALTGGAEYLDDHYGYIFKGFDVSGTLAKGLEGNNVNRPFDKNRTGFLFSQGASATLVLEELEMAKTRKAPILSEIVGFSESFDSHSIMSMDPAGNQIKRMIYNALDEAKITPSAVQYINAHGTGTINNDQIESDVIKAIFGISVLVNSTKSLIGHTIGAAGAVEALVTALSLRDQTTHICKNLNSSLCDLNFVREVTKQRIEIGLSQSFAFGGHNSGLVLKKYCI